MCSLITAVSLAEWWVNVKDKNTWKKLSVLTWLTRVADYHMQLWRFPFACLIRPHLSCVFYFWYLLLTLFSTFMVKCQIILFSNCTLLKQNLIFFLPPCCWFLFCRVTHLRTHLQTQKQTAVYVWVSVGMCMECVSSVSGQMLLLKLSIFTNLTLFECFLWIILLMCVHLLHYTWTLCLCTCGLHRVKWELFWVRALQWFTL